MSDILLWEILVPTMRRVEGTPYRTRYHRVWDEAVRAITGGLTIYRPAVGQWVDGNGSVHRERMIPVRIACTRKQMEDIADMSARYYDQLAIMYYKVSAEVVIKHYDKD